MVAELRLDERLQVLEGQMVGVMQASKDAQGLIGVNTDRADTFDKRLQDIQANITQLTVDLQMYSGKIDNEKQQFSEHVKSQLDANQVALVNVVNDARQEFDGLKTNLGVLFGGTAGTFKEVAGTFQQVKVKVEELEATIQHNKDVGGGGGGWAKTCGFLPIKAIMPQVFGTKEGEWRRWHEDLGDYLDTRRPGLKRLLREAEGRKDPVDEAWVEANVGGHAAEVLKASVDVYRALKALTKEEARSVVQGVAEENGFEAWRQLHMRYSQSTAVKQGKVMCDVASMAQPVAKTAAETRSKVTELERRVRLAEEVTARKIDDGHKKSILAAFLDPTTRAHTTAYQGIDTSYQALKRVVLEFANNTVASKPEADAMDIGCVAAQEADVFEGSQGEDDWGESETEHLAGITSHTQCHRCSGYGHIASQCPTAKGKGKSASPKPSGKAKGKGFPDQGKGKGKGGKAPNRAPQFGTCWTCGGAHFARDCPSAGKGKASGKGINSMSGWPTSGDAVRPLCTVCTVSTRNRFEALEEEDVVGSKSTHAPNTLTLGDFMTVAGKRGSQRAEKARRKHYEVMGEGNVDDINCAVHVDNCDILENGNGGRPTHMTTNNNSTLGQLNPLQTIEPEHVLSMGEQPEWEVIELAVDSGASETVIPNTAIASIPLVPSEASRRGVLYEVANGDRIPNMGEKMFHGFTDNEGLQRSIKAQVCAVNKPLLSVNRLVQAGNTVVFGPEGAYVQDGANAEKIWLRENGGMYMMKLWVPTQGFHRQG